MEENMTNEESLRLITDMIQKAKGTINENGTSSILWGSVIAFCGFVNFAQAVWHFSIGFDIWILALVAIVPQIIISIQERKRHLIRTHTQIALDAVWMVYTISIFALIFYINIVPTQFVKEFTNYISANLKYDGQYLQSHGSPTASTPHLTISSIPVPSVFSLFLIMYAFPTMITGLITSFKPMVLGAVLCYAFFAISLFTPHTWDAVLVSLSGIFNWLIPGILLRKRFLSQAR
jgi:hypothetical protein